MGKKTKQQKISKIIWLEIKHGEDLLKSITDFCIEKNMKSGFISVIGALQKAKFGYYNQQEKKYYENTKDKPVEIISCLGNISVKDGNPFVHAHISVADEKGNVVGGHLKEGCIVFAAECAIFELEGDLMERRFDALTGLSLWDFSY